MIQRSDSPTSTLSAITYFIHIVVCGTKITAASTAATRAEDLANAFTWFENSFPSKEAHAII
jgi:hypothetical protein